MPFILPYNAHINIFKTLVKREDSGYMERKNYTFHVEKQYEFSGKECVF